MKLLLIAAVTLMSLGSFAQRGPGYGPGPGRGGPGYGHGPGRGGSGPGYGQPGPGPGYNDGGSPIRGGDYGPAYTVRWQDFGTTKLAKLIEQDVSINVRGALVNEIVLRAVEAPVSISSVQVQMRNGQVINLRQATGTISEGREVRVRLDRNYSIRAERIVIVGTSAGLIGSRGQVQVILGLAN